MYSPCVKPRKYWRSLLKKTLKLNLSFRKIGYITNCGFRPMHVVAFTKIDIICRFFRQISFFVRIRESRLSFDDYTLQIPRRETFQSSLHQTRHLHLPSNLNWFTSGSKILRETRRNTVNYKSGIADVEVLFHTSLCASSILQSFKNLYWESQLFFKETFLFTTSSPMQSLNDSTIWSRWHSINLLSELKSKTLF